MEKIVEFFDWLHPLLEKNKANFFEKNTAWKSSICFESIPQHRTGDFKEFESNNGTEGKKLDEHQLNLIAEFQETAPFLTRKISSTGIPKLGTNGHYQAVNGTRVVDYVSGVIAPTETNTSLG